MNKLLIIGHRGAPMVAPENTTTSFQKAIDFGADGIELDIHRTSDDQLIVVHNAEFSITDRRTQYVFDHTYPDLKKWFPDLPLLQEVFDLMKAKAIIEIEIKREDKKTIALCLEQIKLFNIESSVEIISSHPAVLAEVRKSNDTIATGLIISTFPDWMKARHREVSALDAVSFINATVAHIRIDYLSQELVQAIKSKGYKVQASAVNSRDDMKRAVQLEVDQITTNDPRSAVAICRT